MSEWKEYADFQYQTGFDILNKNTGKILYNKKLYLYNSDYSKYYDVNVPVSTEIAYLRMNYTHNRGEKAKQIYSSPIVLADHQFRDWGVTRDETIKKFIKVGDFVELRGIRDTNSFRKITDIGDNRIFGIKYVINHKNELQMMYDTSDNYIRFITGVLDEDALNRGEWIRKIDLSKNKEY